MTWKNIKTAPKPYADQEDVWILGIDSKDRQRVMKWETDVDQLTMAGSPRKNKTKGRWVYAKYHDYNAILYSVSMSMEPTHWKYLEMPPKRNQYESL